jgi:flavin-dependent dehydrogenase
MHEREDRPVDVLVVGAGPAGSSAALAAAVRQAHAGGVLSVSKGAVAREGASVLLVDARQEIGSPVRCAEFVPRLMAREVDIPDDAVAQAVGEMVVLVDGLEAGRVYSPGFILHRERFEAELARRAVAAGAEIVMETRAAPGPDGAVDLVDEEGSRRIRPKVVVAADGPLSRFRSGGEASPCLPAVQFAVPLAGPMTCTEVHFARRFRAGYAWLFPKGKVANVGVGCSPAGGRKDIFSLLEAFVEDLRREGKLAAGDPVRRTAGWIPIWGPPASAVAQANGLDVLFAGDAGGFTDPVTGAGIWPAIATGRMAGDAAASAAREGDTSLLSAYDDEWRSLFGAALERSAAARRKMEAEWDSADLACLVREVWPGL